MGTESSQLDNQGGRPWQTLPPLLPDSHGSFFSRLDPKSRAIHAVSTLNVKSSDHPARAELRIACCVTVVQQEHAQAAAALERQLPSANMGAARPGGRGWGGTLRGG